MSRPFFEFRTVTSSKCRLKLLAREAGRSKRERALQTSSGSCFPRDPSSRGLRSNTEQERKRTHSFGINAVHAQMSHTPKQKSHCLHINTRHLTHPHTLPGSLIPFGFENGYQMKRIGRPGRVTGHFFFLQVPLSFHRDHFKVRPPFNSNCVPADLINVNLKGTFWDI